MTFMCSLISVNSLDRWWCLLGAMLSWRQGVALIILSVLLQGPLEGLLGAGCSLLLVALTLVPDRHDSLI